MKKLISIILSINSIYKVHETLKYIIDEFNDIKVLEIIQRELIEYLNKLTGYGNEHEDNENERLSSKVKKGITDRKLRLNRSLNKQKINELNLKLVNWKDRIISEFLKIEN